MPEPIAWINGNIVPFSQAALPVWDLGVVAGAAITELARTFRHRPFRLQDHVARLVDSCRALELHVPYSAAELQGIAEELVRQNTSSLTPQQDLGIVLFVTAGVHPTYLSGETAENGTVAVHTFPLPFKAWQDAARNGVRLAIPRLRQIPAECFPVEYKIRNRMHWWLADREAQRAIQGARALLLDAHDRITETSTAAFFVVINDQVRTSNSGVLNSMSARVVEELCNANGIEFARCPINRSDLAIGQEAFVSSSASCLLPVRSVDATEFGTVIPGPTCRLLQQAWSELVGVDIVGQICSDAV
jgi:branched-chain amino acid aminotransferase